MKKYIQLLLLPALAFTLKQDNPVKVEYKGAFLEIMHDGDLSARIDLKQLQNRSNLYALGIAEDLQGEITVLDGQPYLTQVKKNQPSLSSTFAIKAALLVFSTVNSWSETVVPDSVKSYGQLEAYLPKLAKANGIDPSKPFPFVLEGRFDATWQILDWDEKMNKRELMNHQALGLHGEEKNSNGSIIGFYSTKHQKVWTYHYTYMHLHGYFPDKKIAPHLDNLTLKDSVVVKLPKS
jgi:acetolactate decarboxylase